MINKILKLFAFAIIPVIGIYIYQQSNHIAETTFTIWAYGDAQPKDDTQVQLWKTGKN